jgi:hypothetical protein
MHLDARFRNSVATTLAALDTEKAFIHRRLVRPSNNLSNAAPVWSAMRYVVGHALVMQGKSFRPTALADCTMVQEMPISDLLATASTSRWTSPLQGSNHLLPRGRSELRTALLDVTGSSARASLAA